VADADVKDDELLAGDLVDDPVVADAQPVPVRAADELLDVGVRSPRIVPQGCKRPQDGEYTGPLPESRSASSSTAWMAV
jgi:hypothetical protein